jgi:hypothetical protein
MKTYSTPEELEAIVVVQREEDNDASFLDRLLQQAKQNLKREIELTFCCLRDWSYRPSPPMQWWECHQILSPVRQIRPYPKSFLDTYNRQKERRRVRRKRRRR